MQLRLVFTAAVLTIAGCGNTSKVVPVSGKVMLDGKPLANAHVSFQPLATGPSRNVGPGSYGLTDASGVYTLKMTDSDQSGAVAGQHHVEINLKTETDDRDPKLRPPPKVLPARYNRQSELQFEVPPKGTTEANFDLKSQ